MNVATRGIRNAFRNQIRTFSIVIILGLSMGLALSMVVARQAVQDKIETVKGSIGNTITVSPAGARGFEGGGEALTSSELASVSKVANVSKVTQTLSDRLTTDTTNLTSAVEAGSLGNRRAGDSGVGFQAGPPPSGSSNRQQGSTSTTQVTRTFTPPIIVTGTNDVSTVSVYGGSKVSFTSGTAIDPTKDADEAMIGTALAKKNNLKVGSTFTAYGKTITIVGIYDTGSTFSNAGLIMSLPAVQRLSSQTGSVTSATVTVSSIDALDSAVTAIKKQLGDKADVTSDQATAKQAVAPLENVKTISFYSLVGAVVAGAVIILLTMVMIVRERRREIGVMKAIGASNITTTLQFVCEAITLTVLGMIVGLVIGIAAAKPITNVLVTNSASSSQQTMQGPGSGGPRGGGGGGMRGGAFRSVRDVQASVGLDILGYGIGAALVIAIIGSALPAFLISKVRPAEVMRAE